MKLIHKGLILISVPLAFEIFFAFSFGSLLTRSMEQLKAEVHAKKVIAHADRLECALSESSFIAGLARLSNDPAIERRYDEVWADIEQNYLDLTKIAGSGVKPQALLDLRKKLISTRNSQPSLRNKPQQQQVNRIEVPALALDWFLEAAEDSHPVSMLTQRELRAVSLGAKLHEEMTTQFRNFLLFGVLADIVLVVGLSLFFGTSIEQRLRSLLNTTHLLARGADLAKPLQGNDELAQLDLLLHDVSSRLIEIERFKKQLVGVVCHELKAPLSAVQLLLSLIAAEDNAITQAAREYIQLAQKNCHRLQRMVAELLDVEIMTSGKVRLVRVTTHSGEIMQSAADMVHGIAADHNVDLVLRDSHTDALLDPDRMIQVLVNLLSNAIKFSPDGAQVILESKNADNHLEFSITDHGPGIPEDLHETIFEAFHQVDRPQYSEIKGTGLGLSISKTIVQSHGGSIQIRSSPGQGCTFQVVVPKDGNFVPTEVTDVVNGSINPWSMRIRHKGLILIGLPLLTEILLLGALAVLLQQADHEIENESVSRTVTTESQKLVHCAANSAILTSMGLGRKDIIDLYKVEDRKVMAMMQDLQRTCADSATRTAMVRSITETVSNIRQVQNQLLEESLIHEVNLEKAESKTVRTYLNYWRQLSDQVNKLAIHEEFLETGATNTLGTLANNLDTVLLIGLAVNLLSAIGLTIFLTHNITARITNVKHNAERMLERKPMLAAMNGSDEITHLDRAFRDAASALNEEHLLKQQLIAIASHELRTPLSSISASLELLASGALGKLPEAAQTRVTLAESATERLIALINDILDIEKMAAGKFVLNFEDVLLPVIIARATACIAPLAMTKDITVESKIEAVTVRCDADRLVQVLVNLLSNAVKFSPESQVVSIGSHRDSENCLVITVSDRGCGIPDPMKEKIFDTFITASDTDTNPMGTGLGLPISKAIIEQHGGSIGVESVPGKDTTFWFSLPLVQRNDVHETGNGS